MRLPFKLTENMEISVRVYNSLNFQNNNNNSNRKSNKNIRYNMIMECKKGTPVHLDSKDNEIVKPVTKYTTVIFDFNLILE